MEISWDSNRSIHLTLPDSKVLDCYICFEPLTAPISQCENGHSVCCFCRTKIGESCPSCAQPMSSIRNRALETVLEALKVKCRNRKHGCTKILSYGSKTDHEKSCPFSLCSCSLSPCDFNGKMYQYCAHILKHLSDDGRFVYGETISLVLERNNQYFVLHDTKYQDVFFVENVQEALGQGITVSRFSFPNSGLTRFRFSYDLTLSSNGSNLKFESEIKSTLKRVNKLCASEDFLLIPANLFSSSEGQVNLKLRIHCQTVGAEQRKKSKVSPTS